MCDVIIHMQFRANVSFCLCQAALRRFKPLFDRIVVEKFLPEIVGILKLH